MVSLWIRAFSVLFMISVLATGCARQQSPAEQRVAAEVAEEEPLPPGTTLKEAKQEVLFESENLSPRQRERLQQLHMASARESERLKEELRKNHMVLMRSLVDPRTKDADIEALKDRIVRLERRRTEHFLGSLDSAKRILGRRVAEDEQIYRAFLMEPQQVDLMP